MLCVFAVRVWCRCAQVVEQSAGHVFNKGALFNVGFRQVSHDFDYLCLHDVDQLPESNNNRYEYPAAPTHLCSASSQFGYKMAYGAMVGGALLLTREHYRAVNGYSNFYWYLCCALFFVCAALCSFVLFNVKG
jgi:hypothetical protein